MLLWFFYQNKKKLNKEMWFLLKRYIFFILIQIINILWIFILTFYSNNLLPIKNIFVKTIYEQNILFLYILNCCISYKYLF